jgi:hypothetical protein
VSGIIKVESSDFTNRRFSCHVMINFLVGYIAEPNKKVTELNNELI